MKKDGPRILFFDIETAPHTAYVWGLHNQFVALNQIVETGRVMSIAWRWSDESKVHFASEHTHGHENMVKIAHKLLDESDITVTYNGLRFDIPTLHKEFVKLGMGPPAPSKHIDLLRAVKSAFRFASNKLDHVAQELKLGSKRAHSGQSLWTGCMAGDDKAWEEMERYNKQDVKLLYRLYYRLRPWIKGHPNVTLYTKIGDGKMEAASVAQCPTCGSRKVQSRGTTASVSYVYRRFHCTSCGKWSRSRLCLPAPRPTVV